MPVTESDRSAAAIRQNSTADPGISAMSRRRSRSARSESALTWITVAPPLGAIVNTRGSRSSGSFGGRFLDDCWWRGARTGCLVFGSLDELAVGEGRAGAG
jgi:hypothetical protein